MAKCLKNVPSTWALPAMRWGSPDMSSVRGHRVSVDAVTPVRLLSPAISPGPVSRRLGMKCPRCQQENPLQAKFCQECAAPLALRCANCGTQLPGAAKFCFECATPVSGPASPPRFGSPETYTPKHLAERIINSKAALEGERKQVTVLFADLKGSLELLADRDPEEAR